ncbi:MAG: hypothetical protein V3S68_08825, partial [Dehalococcoidia bacterium]
MTSKTLRAGEPARREINTDAIGDGIAGLERILRPKEGWIAAVLLVVNLMVVVLSVEQADWVATPKLIVLLFYAMLTALVLYRLPVWSIVLVPAGLAVGLGIILLQLSNFTLDGVAIGGTGEVLDRLDLWLDAARSGSINIDGLPFSFALMTATWLTGFLLPVWNWR